MRAFMAAVIVSICAAMLMSFILDKNAQMGAGERFTTEGVRLPESVAR